MYPFVYLASLILTATQKKVYSIVNILIFRITNE